MIKNLLLLVLSAFLLLEAACASKTERAEIGKKADTVTQITQPGTTRDREASNADTRRIKRKTKQIDRSRRLSARLWLECSLSTNAHNVKIVTSAGTVTLRGPVKSTEEKATIEAKAKQVAGVTRVDNLLEIEVIR